MNPHFFEEIQIIGSKKILRQTEAKLFPEKLFVGDLIFNYDEMAIEIGEDEFENMRP